VETQGSRAPPRTTNPTLHMDDPGIDDRTLVDEARAGSQDAFTALVRRYHERLFRVCCRILDKVEDAEEVTQETFARAVTALERFDHRASFYTWLVSIARNAAFDLLRASKRRARHYGVQDGLEDLAVDQGSSPVADSTRAEAAQIVRKALSRLNERDRTLLVLREYENMQYEEIARVLGCSLGTVESGIHRARKKLRYYLQALEPTAGERPLRTR
jgi:RNA polymerase sigma-70 factor (ECF subfamily)